MSTTKKRSLSAYNYFCQDAKQRENITKEHPEWGSAEILKELGSRWKTLNDAEKQPFNELAQKDKQEFEEHKKTTAEQNEGEYEKVEKRPKSSYMHFSNDPDVRKKIKDEHPDWKVTQIAGHLGKQWNEMSSEDRKVWEDKSNNEKLELSKNPVYILKKKKKEKDKSGELSDRIEKLEKIVLELKHEIEQIKSQSS